MGNLISCIIACTLGSLLARAICEASERVKSAGRIKAENLKNIRETMKLTAKDLEPHCAARIPRLTDGRVDL